LQYPISRDIVTNWDDMECIWTHLFQGTVEHQPAINSKDHAFLLTEAPHNPLSNRIKMMEIFLETFNAAGFHAAIGAYLGILAAGRNTGLVVDCGEGTMHTFPVTENHTRSSGRLQRLIWRGVM
jgi:actin beta/gamma 1